MRRSCRERLARHKNLQRRRLQAASKRQDSDTASSEGDDAGSEAQQAREPTVTRAGRKCRPPSLLLPSTAGDSASGAGVRPEPHLAVGHATSMQPVAHSDVGATTAEPYLGNSSQPASGWGGTCQQSCHGKQGEQQQQLQRLPPPSFEQALAVFQHRYSPVPGIMPQRNEARARARCSASTSQTEVHLQCLHVAGFAFCSTVM
jgi:hypothetical protein